MATLAIPVIESIAVRVLSALGVGLTAGAAIEEMRKRNEEAEKAKDSPLAHTDAQTKTEKEKCKECPPDRGKPVARSWSMSESSQAYQARITGFPPGTEWNFAGLDFDGFRSSQCLLQEAKGKYDQFFDEDGVPKEWWASNSGGENGLIRQAGTQYAVALPRPPVRLSWYFMEPKSYSHFTSLFSVQYPGLETVFEP
ncbi:restriction endonuclease fold toxin 5 domain-containing protein [Cupriavidus nantongensis]|nr:hypothetical protein [Cupriavidus taiwanensis]